MLANLAVHGVLVEGRPELLQGFFYIAGVARVLRALLAVHVEGDVPGFLVTQGVGLAQRHVVLDKAGCGEQAHNAGTPVVGHIAPGCREYGVAIYAQARAIFLVANGTVFLVQLFTVSVSEFRRALWRSEERRVGQGCAAGRWTRRQQ